MLFDIFITFFRQKWNNTKKDVVILHAIRRGRTVAHASPFVVKLETFLRMAKIPYEVKKDTWAKRIGISCKFANNLSRPT